MTTLNLAISQSSDDAEEFSAPSSPNLTSSDLDFYGSSSAWVGLRFQNVTIPPSATINSATCTMVGASYGTDCHDQRIYMEDIDDAPTFTTDSGNISSRDLTSASVVWEVPDVSVGVEVTTVDFAEPLQEVIDRGGWASGQDVAVIFNGYANNTNHASLASFDSGSDYPEFDVDYEVGGVAGPLVNAPRLKSHVHGGLIPCM